MKTDTFSLQGCSKDSETHAWVARGFRKAERIDGRKGVGPRAVEGDPETHGFGNENQKVIQSRRGVVGTRTWGPNPRMESTF